MFDKLETLKEHKNDHLTCYHCGKVFRSTHGLKGHIKRVHEGLKEHKCVFCDKLFGHSNDLNFHIKNIHEEKTENHLCIICTKSFKEKGKLKR